MANISATYTINYLPRCLMDVVSTSDGPVMFWSLVNAFDGISRSLLSPLNFISSSPVGSREIAGFECTAGRSVQYIRPGKLANCF